MVDRSRTSTGLAVYVYGGLRKVLALPSTFFASKTNSVMLLYIITNHTIHDDSCRQFSSLYMVSVVNYSTTV